MQNSEDVPREDPERLKQLGNEAFNHHEYRLAVQLWTEALDALPKSRDPDNIELKRTLLANKSQGYHRYGDIHTSLRDIAAALSPDLTHHASSVELTAKCRFRFAKLLFIFTRFEEALAQFRVFEEIRASQNRPLNAEEGELKVAIEGASNTPFEGEGFERLQLLRAADARGHIVREADRPSFPLPPPDYTGRKMNPVLAFNTPDIPKDLSADYRAPPLKYPVMINAPYFKSRSGQPDDEVYRARAAELLPDDAPIASCLTNVFSTVMTRFPIESMSKDELRPYMFAAFNHDSAETSAVIVVTSQGRLLVVPRTATIRQIVEGARWPHPGALPFRNLRKVSRTADDPIDGIGLDVKVGCHIELHVLPLDKLVDFIEYMESVLAD